ncbi:MAG: hypothetical protein CVV44_10155 [Spirochaetae bacterium HGW-Spirochaetae-1]|jgi:hypothetical protein|nr:MAG: hypothetical protein CVV44_10155 [Spirochaetae bacterium HGW-Spirochaetae-1]
MINGEHIINTIAHEIIVHLGKGIRTGDDILEFAWNVIGVADLHETAELICADDAYGQGLAEMVFFPDHTIRLLLEPLIPASGLSREETEKVRELVARSVESVAVSLADDDISITVDVPLCDTLSNHYMRHLNLTRKTPIPLSHPIDNTGKAARYMEARMRIRNSPYLLTPHQERHITDLVRNLAGPVHCSDRDFLQAVDFLLRIMSEKEQDTDLRSLLYENKKTWLNILVQTRRFDEMSRSYSMDFLMSQRIFPPATGYDEALRNIELVDVVSTALYGTAAPSPAGDDSRVVEIKEINAGAMKKILDNL